MRALKIINYNTDPATKMYANGIIIGNRRIYASDYEPDDFLEIRIENSILTAQFSDGYISSSNWTLINDANIPPEDKEYFKDFINL